MTDVWDDEVQGLGRELPHDTGAEDAVAGSVMRRPELIDELNGTLAPEDFYSPRNAWIWHAVDSLREEITSGEIAWNAVDSRLQAWRASGRMPIVPPAGMDLYRIYEAGVLASSAEYYAQIVARKAAARRMVQLGLRAQAAGRLADFEPDTVIPAVQAELDGIVRDDARSLPTLAADLIPEVITSATTPRTREDAVPTGLADLDDITGGWKPGRMIVVGARPGVGKTTFALTLARAAAIGAGLPTLFLSMEMGATEIAASLLAAESSVMLHHITKGEASESEVQRMEAAQRLINAAPLRIDDSAYVTLAHLRHQVRTLQRSEGLRLVVVDYLQLMQAPRAESRQVAVSELSRGLKLLAKEFGIPVIALSQLNRGSEHRADARPTISDLRESGAVEQDADIVVLLHRPDVKDPESPRAGEIDLIVDKHRGGRRATVAAAWQGHYARVIDMGGGY